MSSQWQKHDTTPQAILDALTRDVDPDWSDSRSGLRQRARSGDWWIVVASNEAGYRAALGRGPSAAELQDGEQFLVAQRELYRDAGKKNPRHLALTDFCQVLFSLNEFIYLD